MNTLSSPVLAWRHTDFGKLFFHTFTIKVKSRHLLHETMSRILGGAIHCSVETSRPTDIKHFFNSTLTRILVLQSFY